MAKTLVLEKNLWSGKTSGRLSGIRLTCSESLLILELDLSKGESDGRCYAICSTSK